MRTYGQYCAVAKALDVLGDRWTLLIVRELLLAGTARYTDLRNGLPGIATNLLAERLRELEAAGVVLREEAPPPIATTVFRLTPRGEQLRPLLDELGRWGIPYMVEGPAEGDLFREQWMAWPAELFLADRHPDRPPVSIELHAAERPLVLETAGGEVHVRRGRAEHPDAVLRGAPHPIMGLFSGQIGLEEAQGLGVELEGDAGALRRVLPGTTALTPGGAWQPEHPRPASPRRDSL
jgi:DNA-binding HxlR family transcriptional regulator